MNFWMSSIWAIAFSIRLLSKKISGSILYFCLLIVYSILVYISGVNLANISNHSNSFLYCITIVFACFILINPFLMLILRSCIHIKQVKNYTNKFLFYLDTGWTFYLAGAISWVSFNFIQHSLFLGFLFWFFAILTIVLLILGIVFFALCIPHEKAKDKKVTL